MRFAPALAATALVSSASAATNYLGFNSGSTKADRSAKFQEDFEAEFKTAQGLVGAPGTFNAVRLYTNIQAYSESDPISAFQAAINTKTYILLGIWTSGTTSIDKELTALTAAVKQYGTDFTDLVIGISIGSEDLYRISVTGLVNDPTGVGNSPANIVNFINDYKKAVAGTPLSSVPIGHVDTWDVWGNSSNKAVLDAIDWVGVDEYPYYENGKGNDIKNAGKLFDTAYNNVINTVNGKPVWVTETGWPVEGPNWDQAVPSAENAKYYWDEVGCRKLFNKVPTFWYNLRDSNPDNKQKFAVTTNLSTTPNFNLTCPTTFDTTDSTSSVSSGSPSATSSSGSPAATGVSATTSSSPSGASGAASSTSTTATTTPNAAPSVAMLSTAGYAMLGLMVGAFALL